MPDLTWITSYWLSGCGLAHALVAGYLLDARPDDTSPEALHAVAPELSMLFNWGRFVSLEEPRPYVVRTYLLPSAEVIQYSREATAKVVYVARDPRDLISEAVRGGPVNLENRQRRVKQVMARPDEVRQSDKAHANWHLHAREWTLPDRVRAHFPRLEDMCVIRHEDVAADPAAALRQLVHFLGIPGAVDSDRIRRTVENWTEESVLASDLFELPPGMKAWQVPPPHDDPQQPEESSVVEVERALQAAFQERIRDDAELAALVKQFGYAD